MRMDHEDDAAFGTVVDPAPVLFLWIRAREAINYEGWIMVERDSREPDYIRSARNMRAVMRQFGY